MLKTYEEQRKRIEDSIHTIGIQLIEANQEVARLLEECNTKNHDAVKDQLKKISKTVHEIDNSIVTLLALHSPEASDLRTMVSHLKSTGELLRASSNTRSLAKGIESMCDHIDKSLIIEFVLPMQHSTVSALTNMVAMITSDDSEEMQEYFNLVVVDDSKAADLYELVEDEIFRKVKEIEEFSTFHEILRTLRKSKKISDRAMNIASLLLFAQKGGEIQISA